MDDSSQTGENMHKLKLVDDAEVEAMKVIMANIADLSVNKTSVRADTIANQIAEFIMTLTTGDTELFTRSIRQVMDELVFARQSDAHLVYLREDGTKIKDVNSHDPIYPESAEVKQIKAFRDILDMEGKTENTINGILRRAGFIPGDNSDMVTEMVHSFSDGPELTTQATDQIEQRINGVERSIAEMRRDQTKLEHQVNTAMQTILAEMRRNNGPTPTEFDNVTK